MQNDILTEFRVKNKYTSSVARLQRRLMKSREGRIAAFNQVITSPGKNTPGVDGLVLNKQDEEKVVDQLKQLKS